MKNALMQEKRVAIPQEIYDAADFLTPFGIAVRYPNEMDIDKPLVETAVCRMECIRSWIWTILPQKI